MSLKAKCDGSFELPIYDFLLVSNSNIWPNSAALRYISLWYLSDFDVDFSRSLKVKSDSAIGLPTYGFLLMFNRNIWPNSARLRDKRLRNLSDLEFDFSRSLKVKCDSVIELPIYAFLLMFNSNIWPNSAPLQDIRLQNLNDLDFDFSRSLKVECDGIIGFSIYGFLFICMNNRMSISHRLAVTATQKVFSYLLSLGPNYENSKNKKVDLECYKAKGIPYMMNCYPRVPHFTPFCSKIARFPDNWSIWLLPRLQW